MTSRCYEIRRAEAFVDWSTHHELVSTGESEILRKKERKKKGNALARGSVNWGCDYATALNLEVDPQRSRFRRRESDFALQALTGGTCPSCFVQSCDGIPA